MPLARLLDEKSDLLLCWVNPSSIKIIADVKEEGDKITWMVGEQMYKVRMQAAAFRVGFDLMYFVRGQEPHTFNPFLQSNFDPEFMDRFEGLALQYYHDKGVEVTKDFKDSQTGYWISNALSGSLEKDDSERDFFNRLFESKWMLMLKMVAGVAIWEMLQQLVILIGENF